MMSGADRAGVFCGVDLGSQKTIIAASDGERILTSTGGTSRPTAVSFHDRSRLIGEEAIPQLMSENTVTFLNRLIGARYRDVMDNLDDVAQQPFGFIPYTRMSLVPLDEDDENSLVGVRVAYSAPIESKTDDNSAVFSVPALLGMYLVSVMQQVRDSYKDHDEHMNMNSLVLSFPLPEGPDGRYSPEAARALKEASAIANIDPNSIHITTNTESLAKAYSRKLNGLKAPEKSHLEGNGKVMLIEMGCLQSTIVILEVQADLKSVKVVATENSPALGAFHFDLAIFRHLSRICEEKHGLKIIPGSKTSLRFLTACERLRKLLSQLPEASITVENISDEIGDLNFSLRRDELVNIGATVITSFKGMIATALKAAGINGSELAAVEVLGGGVRMQIVHDAIVEFTGALPLGAKLDEGSMAVGAALAAIPTIEVEEVKQSTEEEPKKESEDEVKTSENNNSNNQEDEAKNKAEEVIEAKWGLSAVALQTAVSAEEKMQLQDRDIIRLLECRNEMESYIFEMRSCPNQKHGSLIADSTALRSTCDEFENWLWDFGDIATLQDILDKFGCLKDKLEGVEVEEESETEGEPPVKRRKGGLCSEYLAVVEKEKKDIEDQLAKEAAAAALERKDDEDQDHDFRKLRKPERMRLVIKNKEEGTELFKGGNIRPAAARYQKALTHSAKFFDLSPEDKEEVDAVKLSLHLNLTQCYLKLESWDNAIRHADEGLKLDPKSVKALFRRSQAWEAKKEYDKAMADMKIAAELNAPKEDKLITKGIERVRRLIQKEKDKEKKMWGKAFS